MNWVVKFDKGDFIGKSSHPDNKLVKHKLTQVERDRIKVLLISFLLQLHNISFVLISITLIALISATCFLFLSANINSFFEENGQVLAGFTLLMTLGVGVFFFIKGKIGNADILFWVISQRILPPVVVVLPVYIMFQRIGLLDTHIAMILTYAVVNLPIVVWLIHDFVLTIPIDLEESAQLDGASRLYIFWDIILPLCKQGLAATTLLILILSWNEYLLASFLSTSKAQT